MTDYVLYGQNDSIILPEINIFAPFNGPANNSAFLLKHRADTNALSIPISLSELLQNDGIYFKTYSSGGLSTVGNRGFGASQTRVYWNGFLLNSPLNGTIDLNLLNIDQANTNVTFVKSSMPVEGGQSGSGGSIWIEPDFNHFKSGLNIALSCASFNTKRGSVNHKWVHNRFSNSSQIGLLSSENNYTYRSVLDPDRPTVQLKDAKIVQVFLMNSLRYRFDKSNLTLHLFVNANNRGIPPPITSSIPASLQKDKSLRIGLAWDKSIGVNSHIAFNAGYLKDDLQFYFDKNAIEHASYDISSVPFSAKGQTFLWDHEVRLNLNHVMYYIQSTEIKVPDEQQSIATIEVNSDERKLLMYGGSLQKMVTSAHNTPFTYRLYIGGRAINGLKLSVSYSTTNQMPGLNDRYWPLSGNPDLLVESGKSIELNLSFNKDIGPNYSLDLASSFFNNSVDNWIAWIPVTGDFWRPFNVQKVNSKGMDLNIKQRLKLGSKLRLSAIYNLSHAQPVIKSVYKGSPAIVGKQLIYVPSFQQSITFKMEMERNSFFANWRLTGSRFTTSDNDEGYKLRSYNLLDIGYQFKFKLFRSPFQARVQVNNLFNQRYENIAYRPMPGRNFELGIGCKF